MPPATGQPVRSSLLSTLRGEPAAALNPHTSPPPGRTSARRADLALRDFCELRVEIRSAESPRWRLGLFCVCEIMSAQRADLSAFASFASHFALSAFKESARRADVPR